MRQKTSNPDVAAAIGQVAQAHRADAARGRCVRAMGVALLGVALLAAVVVVFGGLPPVARKLCVGGIGILLAGILLSGGYSIRCKWKAEDCMEGARDTVKDILPKHKPTTRRA